MPKNLSLNQLWSMSAIDHNSFMLSPTFGGLQVVWPLFQEEATHKIKQAVLLSILRDFDLMYVGCMHSYSLHNHFGFVQKNSCYQNTFLKDALPECIYILRSQGWYSSYRTHLAGYTFIKCAPIHLVCGPILTPKHLVMHTTQRVFNYIDYSNHLILSAMY